MAFKNVDLDSHVSLTEEEINDMFQESISKVKDQDTDPDTNTDSDIDSESDFAPKFEKVPETPDEDEPEKSRNKSDKDKGEEGGIFSKKSLRAQKRIQQLIEQRREMEDIVQNQETLIHKLESRLSELETNSSSKFKTDKESLKSAYEAQLKAMKKQMAQAIQEGEAEKAVDIQEDMTKLQMRLASVNYEIQKMDEAEVKNTEHLKSESKNTKNTNESKQSKAQIPEKALEWIEDHPTFKTDPVFYASAIVTNNQLIQEGMDPEDEDFYEELNQRLGKRFHEEIFGEEGNSMVDSRSNPSQGKVRDTSQTNSSPPKRPKQTVQGGSRDLDIRGTPSPNDPNKVTLSQEDLIQIDRFGLDKRDFARRKMMIDKHYSNKDRFGGYIPIKL